MADSIPIFFENKQETLRLLDTGGDVVAYLSNTQNKVCPLLGSKIKLDKKLGEGQYGAVYTLALNITFENKENKKYVVKKTLDTPYEIEMALGNMKVRQILDKHYDIDRQVFMKFNNFTDPEQVINMGTLIKIPIFASPCKINQPRYYESNNRPRTTLTLKAGSYVCESETFSEYLISLLVADLYRTGTSIHFINTFSFATCLSEEMVKKKMKERVHQYIFMERIDNTLEKVLMKCILKKPKQIKIGFEKIKSINDFTTVLRMRNDFFNDVLASIIIQVLHSFVVIQDKFKLVHGDLHLENVFLEFVTPETTWKGEKLLECDYYEYKIGRVSIYTPGGHKMPLLAKLGDWGLGSKFSEPAILRSEVVDGVYEEYPNFYSEIYDSLVFLGGLFREYPKNETFSKIMSYVLQAPAGSSTDILISFYSILYGDIDSIRPTLSKMKQYGRANPRNLLKNKELFGKFMVTPPAGSRIITLGEI
jgi:serine/threonine protein kinase